MPFAQLGKARSAGIKDLRNGDIRAEDWQPATPGVPREARPGSRFRPGFGATPWQGAAKSARARPARARGDGLVPVGSALGRHVDGMRGPALPDSRCRLAYGTGHFDLLDSQWVYEALRDCLGGNL